MWERVGSWIRANVEEIFLVLTAIVAIVFLTSSHLGLNIFNQYSNDVVVTLLCLIALCLFFEGVDAKKSKKELDEEIGSLKSDLDHKFNKVCGDLDVQVSRRHELLLSRVIESVAGLEYRRFRDATDFLNYLAERILQAKSSVWDLTWVLDQPAERGAQEAVQAEHKYHSAILESSKRISYREVFVFCDASKYEKLKKVIQANPPYYHCRYYEESKHDSKIPRPVFMVIDREEVLLYGITSDGVYCTVRHVRLVESFVDYYQALWEGATKLKEGPTIYMDEYNKVIQGH